MKSIKSHIPILHSSNPTLFQSYTLQILHSSNPTPFKSYTFNPTSFQSYTFQSFTIPILHSSNLTLFQSYTANLFDDVPKTDNSGVAPIPEYGRCLEMKPTSCVGSGTVMAAMIPTPVERSTTSPSPSRRLSDIRTMPTTRTNSRTYQMTLPSSKWMKVSFHR